MACTPERQPHQTWSAYPALTNPRFVRIFIGDLVSGLGNSAYMLAASFFIYQLTGEVGPIAGLWAARVLARLLLQPLAGALVDRWDRRCTVIVANLASAGAVSLFPLADVHRLYLFFMLTAAVQGVNDFLTPAFNAWIPAVVDGPELLSANALFQAGSGAVGFIGPALMGFLYHRLGPRDLFWLDGASFLAAAAAAWSVPHARTRRDVSKPRASLLGEVRDGLRWMWRRPLMRTVILLILVNSVMWRVLEIVLVPLTDGRWHVGAAGLGLLYSALAAGELLAGLVLGRTHWCGGRRLMAAAFFVQAAVLLSVLAGPPVAYGGVLASGFVAAIAFTWNRRLLQTAVPESLRGRAFATLNIAAAVGVLPALVVLGPAVTRFGELGVAGGAVVLLLMVSAWLASGCRPSHRPLWDETG